MSHSEMTYCSLTEAANTISQELGEYFALDDLFGRAKSGRLALSIVVTSIFGERLVYFLDKKDLSRFRNNQSSAKLVQVALAWGSAAAARGLRTDHRPIVVNRQVKSSQLIMTASELERYVSAQRRCAKSRKKSRAPAAKVKNKVAG
jgi:hypothetical protein